MVVTFILIGLIILFFSAFSNFDGDDTPKILVFLLGVGLFGSSLYYLSFHKGQENGAYNQLRGKYDVTYVIDKDSCVVDTIIHFN